jgi:hypothetical protein
LEREMEGGIGEKKKRGGDAKMETLGTWGRGKIDERGSRKGDEKARESETARERQHGVLSYWMVSPAKPCVSERYCSDRPFFLPGPVRGALPHRPDTLHRDEAVSQPAPESPALSPITLRGTAS